MFEELSAIINDSAPGVPLDLLCGPLTFPRGIFGTRRHTSESFWYTFEVPKRELSIKIQCECPCPRLICPPYGSSVNREPKQS